MTPLVYRALSRLALPAVLARLYWQGRRDESLRADLAERLGRPGEVSGGPVIWVHAASVGEVRAVAPLVRAMAAAGRSIHLTTNTTTGRQTVEQLDLPVAGVTLAPLDSPGVVARFLSALRPVAAVMVELELWPNRLLALQKAGIPVALVNARLSEQSLNRYQRLGALIPAALDGVRRVAAQTEDDARRLATLGVPAQRIRTTGNLKFDQTLDEAQVAAGHRLREMLGQKRPVWVAASARNDEIAPILTAHERLLQAHPQALLILVPRHPDRVTLPPPATAQTADWQWARRSSGEHPSATTQVFVGDTLGELPVFLAAADVAFVGGSLVAVGGHNPLEPALLGLPVLMGPHVRNVVEIDNLLAEAGGRRRVMDAHELADALIGLFNAPALAQRMGQAAQSVAAAHGGACKRTMDWVAPLLP
jgi:3-deoxy-D-manno-octulosonic-acid transferase